MQSTEAILHFVPVLWPDYTFWEFQKSIFFYQRQKMLLQKLKLPKPQKFEIEKAPENVKDLLEDVEDDYWTTIEKSAAKFRPEMYTTQIASY